jgi:hypothetical protein
VTKYPTEVAAIRYLRGMAPKMGAWALACRIHSRGFTHGTRMHKLSKEAIGSSDGCFSVRPFYSVLSVIRRYDAARAARREMRAKKLMAA